jgi:hypothetical protein
MLFGLSGTLLACFAVRKDNYQIFAAQGIGKILTL